MNGDNNSLLLSVLKLGEIQQKNSEIEMVDIERHFKLKLQRIYDIHERQLKTVSELREMLEYISQHAHIVRSALKAASGETRAVPLSRALIGDLQQVRTSMEETIKNVHVIKRSISTEYQPYMDNLLVKMQSELSKWTTFLNSAASALVNSKALMENVQNLLTTQEQICSEVATSELFLSVKDNTPSIGNATKDNGSTGATSPGMLSTRTCSTPVNSLISE